MAHPMAEKMSQASDTGKVETPKKGQRFRCEQCGMEIQVASDCKCKNGDHVHFECCGQEMMKQ
jgi:hypothetical protein